MFECWQILELCFNTNRNQRKNLFTYFSWQPAPKGAAPCQLLCNEQLAENQILKLICETLDELQLCNTSRYLMSKWRCCSWKTVCDGLFPKGDVGHPGRGGKTGDKRRPPPKWFSAVSVSKHHSMSVDSKANTPRLFGDLRSSEALPKMELLFPTCFISG